MRDARVGLKQAFLEISILKRGRKGREGIVILDKEQANQNVV